MRFGAKRKYAMAEYRKLISLMDELISLFREIIELENNKLDAIAVNDVQKIEEFMKDEQVMTLKLKGLDSKRDAVQAACGLDGLTLKEIVGKVQSPDAEILAEKDEQLRFLVEELQTATACTQKFIELHLHSLDMLLAQLDEPPKNETYDNLGEKQKEEQKRFSPKKV